MKYKSQYLNKMIVILFLSVPPKRRLYLKKREKIKIRGCI